MPKLLLGRVPELKVTELDKDEENLFDEEFGMLVSELERIDPDIATEFSNQSDTYKHAAAIAKGYFDQIPFAGLRSVSGTFGFRFLLPQDFGYNASNWPTADKHKWEKNITLPANENWADLFGSSSSPIRPSTTADKRSVLAFHKLISYRASPRMADQIWNINRYPYIQYSVEPFSKLAKQGKTYKLYALPGPIVMHPGGEFYARAQFEKENFGSEETYTIEIAPLGLLFAEFDYLKEELK